MGRVSPTYWRYAFVEALRLVVITTLILVGVISFAAAVRWFADGKLGPLDMVRFMGFASVPMLAYALPFSACFAATLTFHRLAQDNELLACHVGGMSHRAVLAPAVVLGVVLAITLGVLNDRAIPWFLRRMENLITLDLTRVIVSTIDRGDAVQLDPYVINAESVEQLDPSLKPEYVSAGVLDWLVFRDLILLQFDREGNLVSDLTAQEAQLFVFPGPDPKRNVNLAQFHLFGAYGNYSDSGARGSAGGLTLDPMEIPNAFKDDPKFMTSAEMTRLARNPDRIDEIHSRRADLAYHLGERATTAEIGRELRQEARAEFVTPEQERLVLHGSSIAWKGYDAGGWVVAPSSPGGPVEVDVYPAEGSHRSKLTHSAVSATLETRIGEGPRLRELTIDLVLHDVAATRESGDRVRLVYARLQLADEVDDDATGPVEALLAKPSLELLAMAEPRIAGDHPDEFLVAPTTELRNSIDRLGREIVSKRNERWAMSASCFVMVLCGAVAAMRLGSAQPLIVYLWSFFPALFTVITISGGQSVTHKTGLGGLAILWGGVAVLAVYTALVYRAVSRH